MNPEHQAIISQLQSGYKIVTASHRQARFIHKLWQQQQQSISWQQAECFAWDEWLQQLFEYSTLFASLQKKSVPRILSPFEQRWLWKKLLQKQLQDSKNNLLLKPLEQQQSLLDSLLQAWKNSSGWRVDVNSKEYQSTFNSTEETKIFKTLVNQFKTQCQKNNWLSQEQLADYLGDNFNHWDFSCDEDIYFYGFDDWTPQQTHFLNKVKQTDDITSSAKSEIALDNSETLNICASKYAEWQQAAQWARQLAESQANAEIAVVIPDLSSEREHVLRIFQEVFQPQLQLQAEGSVAVGFNISAGEPINQQAIVQSARLWLGLLNGAAGNVWQQAIVNEFCQGSDSERWQRAKLKSNSNLGENIFYSVSIYQKQLLKKDVIPIKIWLGLINRLLENQTEIHTKKTPAEWVLWSEVFLEKMGWPGSSVLSSKTYQAKNQWLDSLRKLSSMESFCGQIAYSDFLSLLDEQIASMSFQPETPAATVQVLGVFEAIGLGFDYLWLTGCQTNNFPPAINANPWLPIHLQQQLNMPGGSSQREQQFTAKLFTGFKRHCKQLYFSYAVADAEAEQTPSSFIEHLMDKKDSSKKIIAEEISPYWLQQTEQSKQSLCLWDDSQGDRLASEKINSGVAILRDQAACPFKAYANFRLNASSDDRESIGIDALQRGNWVHATLEMIWRRLKTQQALLKLGDDALFKLVEDSAREIILTPSKLSLEQQSPLIKLEYERTLKLVLAWLQLDRDREPFERVEVEQATEVTVGSLKFEVRADRIDNFSDGSKLVLDYKTGRVNCNSWFNQRITEPQLPLYGLLFANRLRAVAFAQLTIEGCLIKGFGEENTELTGIQGVSKKEVADWKSLIQQWQSNLENIAKEYAQGLAVVEPQPGACDYCEFPHLCRRDAYLDADSVLVAQGDMP